MIFYFTNIIVLSTSTFDVPVRWRFRSLRSRNGARLRTRERGETRAAGSAFRCRSLFLTALVSLVTPAAHRTIPPTSGGGTSIEPPRCRSWRNLHRTTTIQELAEPPSSPTMLQTTGPPPRKGTQTRNGHDDLHP